MREKAGPPLPAVFLTAAASHSSPLGLSAFPALAWWLVTQKREGRPLPFAAAAGTLPAAGWLLWCLWGACAGSIREAGLASPGPAGGPGTLALPLGAYSSDRKNAFSANRASALARRQLGHGPLLFLSNQPLTREEAFPCRLVFHSALVVVADEAHWL
ncbi:MAG: hypothetical protein ACUVRE_06180 [Thermoanaerobaculaceae bacterium]